MKKGSVDTPQRLLPASNLIERPGSTVAAEPAKRPSKQGKRKNIDVLEEDGQRKKISLNSFAGSTVGALALAETKHSSAQQSFVSSFVCNDLDGIRAAVDAGADINQKVSKYAGFTIQIAAEDHSMFPTLKLLVSLNADVNVGNAAGGALLAVVLSMNTTATELLLKAGADPFAEAYTNLLLFARAQW